MPNFKVPLHIDLLQVCGVLVIITGDTFCHSQVLHSSVYALVIMKHGKVGCLLIVNVGMPLIRDLEDRLVPDHSEGFLWILKSLEIH